MTRATIVLELQSNTPLFATVRVNKAGQKECINPLCMRDAVMRVNTVSTGRWTASSDDGIAILELHFWRQRDERSTSTDSPDFTVDVALPSSWTDQMYIRAMEVSIKKTKSISIVPASLLCPGYNTVNCVQFLFHMTHDNVAFKKMMCGLPPRRLEGAHAAVA
jgi:hypothetical protein